MIRSLVVSMAGALLVGCASVAPENLSTVKLRVAPIERAEFVLVDQRPAESKQMRTDTGVGSGNQLSFLGDDSLSPPPVELMRAWLHQKAGAKLAGQTVFLNEFELRIFDPSVSVDQGRLLGASAGVPGGLLVAPIAGAFIYGIEKMRREINTNANIRITVNGVEISASGVRGYRGQVNEDDLANTVQLALDDLAIKLAGLPPAGLAASSEPAR
jgi:hypothetical protein